jgi:hypothetical protein
MRVFAAALVLLAVYFPAAIYLARSYTDPESGLRPLPLPEYCGGWLLRVDYLGAKRNNQSCDLQRRGSSGIRNEGVR